jgi:hypothetical protein
MIGYAGSLLVAISLMMKNILRLRQINLIGSGTFAIYGLLVNAYPVFLLNSFIAVVDVYYLYGMYKNKNYFTLLKSTNECSQLLNEFINFYGEDIKKFFPGFSKVNHEVEHSYFIMRNLMPVGLFVFEKISDDEVKINLDYAIPDYRDLENARFLYGARSEMLKSLGCKKLITESDVDSHIDYLLKIGFRRTKENSNIFEKNLETN